jgi:predicted unusual protein kinase regulating ubiquinone biosynthesis (AarF/ABC1/UbiB family)
MPLVPLTTDGKNNHVPLVRRAQVRIGHVLNQVMDMARRHHVMVDSQFATLVISITILEGALDPGVRDATVVNTRRP